MEFGTGHEVRPGDNITLETSAGAQDLGQATYDSDHDGVGDSVIVIQDDHEYLITDADHDGYADSVRAFDGSGQEIDPSSGHPLDPPSDGTGQGSNLGNLSPAGYSSFGSAAADAAGASSGLAVGAADGSGMTVTGEDGSEHDLGAATVDLDRDGTPDTAVVREADGAVIGYTDRDGDGIADQMTRIGADGDVVIAVSDGSGGWEVAATGHLDDSGALVEDPDPADLPAG